MVKRQEVTLDIPEAKTGVHSIATHGIRPLEVTGPL